MANAIRYSVEKNVACVVLDRPKANCLNSEMARSLLEALRKSDSDPRVHVRYIIGEGRFFSAGLDLKSIDTRDIGQIRSLISNYLNPIMLHLLGPTKPTICAVNGPAVGAGAGIALGTDFIYAADSATLSFPFVRLGLIPDTLLSYTLPTLVGYRKALELFCRAEAVSSREALDLTLVDRVYPDAELQVRSIEKARELAAQNPRILKAIKQVLVSSRLNQVKLQADTEYALQSVALSSPNFISAVLRFQSTH